MELKEEGQRKIKSEIYDPLKEELVKAISEIYYHQRNLGMKSVESKGTRFVGTHIEVDSRIDVTKREGPKSEGNCMENLLQFLDKRLKNLILKVFMQCRYMNLVQWNPLLCLCEVRISGTPSICLVENPLWLYGLISSFEGFDWVYASWWAWNLKSLCDITFKVPDVYVY